MRNQINRTTAYEDERPKLPSERELPAHGDTLAEVLLQIVVGRAGQIKPSRNLLRLRWRWSTLHLCRCRSALRAFPRREK